MRVLKASHYVLTRVIVVVMILLLLLSGYFLWSNLRTYHDAEDVYNSLLKLKPDIPDDDGPPDLKALSELNPDVVGWLTVEGTKIDYPVVQGRDNLYYMNRDFYGNSSLAGSIFLDTRNSRDFSDAYSLLYGHHMDNSLMFGDLDLFKDKLFFRDHSSGTLMTLERVMDLNVLAVLEISDSTQEIFNPTMWGGDLSDLAAFVKENALYVKDVTLSELSNKPKLIQVIALVTCASGHTGTRTVLLLTAERDTPNPEKVYDGDVSVPVQKAEPPAQTRDVIWNSPVFWLVILLIGLTVLLAAFLTERKQKKSDKKRTDKQ